MMNRSLLHIFCCSVAAMVLGQDLQEGASSLEDPPSSSHTQNATPQSALDILTSTVSHFPQEPIALSGAIILRKQAGIIVNEIPFSINLDWGSNPARAAYTIYDGFGKNKNILLVERSSVGELKLSYLNEKNELIGSPQLTDSIAGTDITWLDITLSFLWWQDCAITGSDTFKGTLCDIIETHPPTPITGCKTMRLWIDRKHGFLRQAEQLNEEGKRVRWMWVSSVGKINNRWMIKNLEVKRPGTGLQTKLHIDEVL